MHSARACGRPRAEAQRMIPAGPLAWLHGPRPGPAAGAAGRGRRRHARRRRPGAACHAVGGQPAAQGARAGDRAACCWCGRSPVRVTEPGRAVLRLARRARPAGRRRRARARRRRRPGRAARRGERRLARHLAAARARAAAATRCCSTCTGPTRTTPPRCCATAPSSPRSPRRPTPVPGCTSTPLGVLRYRPAAAPGFVQRWFPDGPTAAALGRAPVVALRPRRRPPAGLAAPAHPRPGRPARAPRPVDRGLRAARSWPGSAGGCSATCSSPSRPAHGRRPARPRGRRRRAAALAAVEGCVPPSLERLSEVVLAGGRAALAPGRTVGP